MAKRKAAARARGKARKGATAGRKRSAGRKRVARRTVGKTAARKTSAAARKAVARKARARKASGARRATAVRRAAPARKAAAPKAVAPASAKAPARSRRSAEREGGRKAPALDRERLTIQGDDIVPTPPSSLNLDRTASAARSGRRQMRDRLAAHHETSPALTAGDVDADWESAASVGDEAPGGDNPTPDQDVVDDIGRAVGVQYDDNEELKGEAKIAKRDKHRWELDPASSEDYEDR